MARTGSGGRRAGGAPLGTAVKKIASIIEARSTAVTITRPTTTTDSLDAETETTTTFTEDLWLTNPSERVSQVDTGERVQGDLMALGLDGIDIQKDDRLTYGGVEYEVDTVVGQPDDAQADGTTHSGVEYFSIMLVRRQ